MKSMRQVVTKFNISHWVKIFMNRLKEVKAMQARYGLEMKFDSVPELVERFGLRPPAMPAPK